MSLVAFKAKNHPQQTRTGAKDHIDDRGTSPEFFATLSQRFGGFSLDVAASDANAKCSKFLTRGSDGLQAAWAGERVWCNPPYSDIASWVSKAWHEYANGTDLIVMLLPANRTEQRWWQVYVEPFRDKAKGLRIEFLPGRLRFVNVGKSEIGPNERPPFGCCLAIWSR